MDTTKEYNNSDVVAPLVVLNDSFQAIMAVPESGIPYMQEVTDAIKSQNMIRSNIYSVSLVAFFINEANEHLYSVNYTYINEIRFTQIDLQTHKRTLQRELPPNLALKHVNIIKLQIGGQIVTKLQATYRFRNAVFEMNTKGVPVDDLYYHVFEECDEKDLWLFDRLCDMCSWEGIECCRFRDNRLMVLLRRKIDDLRKCRCKTSNSNFIRCNKKTNDFDLRPIIKKAKIEMDTEGVTMGEKPVFTSNVVLSETQQESKDIASAPVEPEWHLLASNEATPQYTNITNRFLYWKTLQWTTSNQPENFTISRDVLPLSFLNSSNKSYCSTPNFIPFNIHAYWRGDLEVKIHINSNQFQSGMLLCSWLYASNSFGDDENVGPRYANVALKLQRPHVKISAGASNEATLYIPYRYIRPFMRTKNYFPNSPAKSTALNMGTLDICPLVPLMTGTSANSPQQCSVSLFIRFVNSNFTGMIDGSIAHPEMDRVGRIVSNTLGVVDKVLGDINCDNPPGTKPAQFLVPINAQSWSHGVNTYEPINTLRLDGGRIGVGRSKDIGYSETNIRGIVSVYGLLRPIQWKYSDTANNISGKQLWGMQVHPQCDKDKIYLNTQVGAMDMYTLPPVGVISSLFCYWRGSLNFKFDIICTSKHTGRILVAYIPGVIDYSVVTLQQAKSSAHVEFSLNTGTTSFTFQVPYVAETMWWQRKYGGSQRASDFIAPSSIVMFVLNPLVPMESVAQQVDILPYICAGDDFEVSVPAQPSIGLAVNRINLIPEQDKVEFKSGYYPVYAGEWRNFMNGNKYILRYGNVSDHVAQLTNPPMPPKGTVYYYKPEQYSSVDITTEYAGGRDKVTGITVPALPSGKYPLVYGVIYPLDGYYYMIPIVLQNIPSGPQNAENSAKVIATAIAQGRLDSVSNFVSKWVIDSEYLTNGNIRWQPVEYVIPSSTVQSNASPEMGEPIQLAREETPNLLTPVIPLPTTRGGIVTFGERFTDLKDLNRRYQLYWEGTVTPGQIRANKRNAALVQIPILPQGLYLDPSLDNPVWNSMREGHIPVISSGFRFYRGGQRLRIVITGLDGSIWVQHHPDRQLTQNAAIIGSKIQDKDAYRNHTYGFYVQNMTVNRTIEIEIPFYKPGLYNLLGNPGKDYDSLEYTSLGDVVIGMEGDQVVNTNVDIAIYYCISDDMSFNVFCGFPAMVYCDEVFKQNVVSDVESQDFEFLAIPETKAVPEMMAVGSFLSSATSSIVGNIAGSVISRGSRAITEPISNVVKKEVKQNVEPVLRDIENHVINAANEMSATLGRTIPQQAIIGALGQFSQVALNPNPTAIAIAITTMLANFVVISLEMILSLQSLLTQFLEKVWYKYFSQSNDLQADGRRSEPEGFFDEMEAKELNGFLGIMFSAVAATVGIQCSGPSSFPNVMKGVKECLNVCNASVVFFRNIVDTVVYMYKYCLGETSEELKAKIIIEREYPHMKEWCEEVMALLDPRNLKVIYHSSRQANRVFDACIYGSKLIRENLDKNVPGGKVIYDLYTKICKLRDDLIELGNHPDVRFETFPIWVCGPAGVGKSHMTNKVCKDLLQHIQYETKEMMIYWLALGQKYWNGVGNNPVIARDEGYAVGGQFTEEEIATHLAICSSSILNPPMAAIQEKNKRLNPLIYYINSNCEFPTINEARHPEAIYRRRKLLVRVEYTPEIRSKYPNLLDASMLSPNEVQNYAHLQFRIALDPKNVNTLYSDPMMYDQFISIAKRRFKAHVDNERMNFRQRMMDAYALDPDYDQSDELNYVHGANLDPESLHDKYLKEKAKAREYLYSVPPTIDENDPYLQQIMNKFSYLWTVPRPDRAGATPEMDGNEYVPSTSNGFYGDTARACAEKIKVITNMDRGAIMKMVSGNMVYEDHYINNFCIDPEFSKLIKSKEFKMSFSVLPQRISMFSDEIQNLIRQCGFDDTFYYSQGCRFMSTYLPHWEDVTGTDCIRSYVYWMMRQHQYRIFLKLMKNNEKLHIIEEAIMDMLRVMERPTIMQKIRQLKSAEEIVSFFKKLDNTTWGADRTVDCEIYCLLLFLNRMYDNNLDEFCEHCTFWVGHVYDTSKMEYSPRQDTILYYNTLGLRMRYDNYCKCKSSFANNPLFQNAMRIIWNYDHGSPSADLNPFSFAQHKNQHEHVQGWLLQVWDYVKDWWRNVAQPFVSVILTFVYEHFFKIVMVLLGLYHLYNVYSNNKKETHAAASAVYTTVSNAADYVIGSVISSGLSKQTHTTESASPEAPNYFKQDKPKAANASFRPANKESSGIVDQLAIFENRIKNNFCFLICRYVEKDLHGNERYLHIQGRCLAIRERQVLVIRHYLEEMLNKPGEPTYMLSYVVNGKESTGFLTRSCLESVKYYKTNGKDGFCNFGILTLPKFMPMFKDITSSIARLNDHSYVSSNGHMLSISSEGIITRKNNLRLRAKQHLIIGGDDHVTPITNDVSYEYSIRGKGMCGSLLLCDNICKGNPGIIGLHVAGLDGNGYAEPIYREMFEKAIEKPKVEYIMPQLHPLDEANLQLDTNLLMYGTVDPKYAHKESGKTKIVPSLLHGKVYPVKTEPNPLRPGDPRQPKGSHPLRDGCNKHGDGFSVPFDPNLLDIVSHDSRNLLLNEVHNPLMEMRVLTFEEAICGSILIPHCESLNWKSSEGYPLSSLRPQQFANKKYLFDLEESKEGYRLKGLLPELEKLLQIRERFRNKNVVLPPLYIDCLKDYRLTPQKCAIPGKTRIFSIAPVQVTIDVRRYMGLFLSGYKTSCIVAEHGIGINVDSLQWTQLANYLLEVGNNIVTGDYSNFGPTLSSQIVFSCFEDILYWHKMNGASKEHLQHLEYILENEILNPWHLCDNLVYQTLNGIASGSPITAELNSEVNKKYIKLAFLLLSKKENLNLTMKDFHLKIRLVTYGDDFIMSVHDDYINWFNCKTISDVLRPNGIVLTDVEKGTSITPYRRLQESTFLKRSFALHPTRCNVYLAPIDTVSVTECLNWCHKQIDEKAATEEVVRASCVLAYGHGPKFYREHTNKIRLACLNEGLKADFISWEEMDIVNFG